MSNPIGQIPKRPLPPSAGVGTMKPTPNSSSNSIPNPSASGKSSRPAPPPPNSSNNADGNRRRSRSFDHSALYVIFQSRIFFFFFILLSFEYIFFKNTKKDNIKMDHPNIKMLQLDHQDLHLQHQLHQHQIIKIMHLLFFRMHK